MEAKYKKVIDLFEITVEDLMIKNKCKRSEAIKMIANKDPELHRAYIKSTNAQ